jgi:TIR domain
MSESGATRRKVFMSHASEDKDRFVLPFATKLQARGLDVWVDRWEMLPGDSLVKKIFTEGIGEAEAVIVVLSKQSVNKRWVAEELDAAVVKRIQEESLLIPIVLDGLQPSELPTAVRHLLFEPVTDTSRLDDVLDRTVRAVLGQPDKPPLGTVPRYATADVMTVPGLDRIDSLMLKTAGEEAVRDFGERFRTQEFFESVKNSLGIGEQDFIESLNVLHADGYIRLHRTLGSGLPSMASFDLTPSGLETYAKTCVEGYDQMVRAVKAYVGSRSEDQGTDREVAERLGYPRLLVLHILRRFDAQGLLSLSESYGPVAHFYNVSPKLRRLVADG